MGAYKYIGELYKKKQSDVLRFLLRVRYATNFFVCRWTYFDREYGTAAGSTAS